MSGIGIGYDFSKSILIDDFYQSIAALESCEGREKYDLSIAQKESIRSVSNYLKSVQNRLVSKDPLEFSFSIRNDEKTYTFATCSQNNTAIFAACYGDCARVLDELEQKNLAVGASLKEIGAFLGDILVNYLIEQ
jgi:hypothetical protein